MSKFLRNRNGNENDDDQGEGAQSSAGAQSGQARGASQAVLSFSGG